MTINKKSLFILYNKKIERVDAFDNGPLPS